MNIILSSTHIINKDNSFQISLPFASVIEDYVTFQSTSLKHYKNTVPQGKTQTERNRHQTLNLKRT